MNQQLNDNAGELTMTELEQSSADLYALLASLAMIVEELRAGRGMPPRLFRAPWLRVVLESLGRRRLASKLFDADVFDGAPLRQAGWQPPFGTREALRLTGASP